MTTIQSAVVNGSLTVNSTLNTTLMTEKVTVSNTPAKGTINFDVLNQSILFHDIKADGNWTLNVRGNNSTTFGSLLSVGQSISITFMTVNGPIGYYPTGFKIDGTDTTVFWLDGASPLQGNSSTVSFYQYSIIKKSNTAYTVLASTSLQGFGDLSEQFGLYNFRTHTFTTAGVTGRFGPTLTQIRSAYSSTQWAQNNSYLSMNVQGIQRWTVPFTATYRITAAGACGSGYGSAGNNRGYGAVIRGDFNLQAGQIIQIAVGQAGTGNGGGGGGSFVVREVNTVNHQPLIIAGGGGAQDARYGAQSQFHDASYTNNGNPGGGASSGGGVAYNGGQGGQGGQDGGGNGGAGGGFFTNGGSAPGSYGGYGFLQGSNAPSTNSLVGGNPDNDGTGGFGGGAGSSDDQGAAGGGYSGGGGTSEDQHGGGGGSYNNGSNAVNLSYNTSGPGYVTIERLT